MNKPISSLGTYSLIGLLMSLSGYAESRAATIRVPADAPTIQQGINAARDGDTVLVAAGTYTEKIDFMGKGVTVRSESGAERTIINGVVPSDTEFKAVVTFNGGESADAGLIGFTIQNGSGLTAGGIYIRYASPQIVNNIIKNNKSGGEGGGISIIGGAPYIVKNLISNNTAERGGGISVSGGTTVLIGYNEISQNIAQWGGGIYDPGGGDGLVIIANVIRKNQILHRGGGIFTNNSSRVLITQNLIVDNFTSINATQASEGGGIYWLMSNQPNFYRVVNNTIVNNDADHGSGVFADGYDVQTQFINNLVVARPGRDAFYCGDFNDLNLPIIKYNDIYATRGKAFAGIAPNLAGVDGNISIDPQFVDPDNGNYHLKITSPLIDVGDTTASAVTGDFDGNPRIVDGDGNGSALVDIGAYEYQLTTYDVCIQDDASKDTFKINSTTGEFLYLRCQDKFTVRGIGKVNKDDCLLTLKSNSDSLRVKVKVKCSNKASVALTLLPQDLEIGLSDKNITNNTCGCPNN